ncbi:amidohydrolase family protein [Antrihabitans cavernicola]|uniref:Amidohydrolase family protein n=1 Tax=Antrihabitans cavernicola TaxID=2495913 RepID=A0A5A7S2D6_9NOCA|nr:amidohydrolase family protein [Spelaeibacter cavernicola]KAA0017097.1 amidohydrolase family protein [Spelaeibacter cavernicola]
MFDAHLHIIDPRFPLIENEGYLPDPFTVADYHERMAGFDVHGGAVVTASFQGTDQSYLVAALAELGNDWVGVTQLDPDVTDDDIVELDKAGIRGIRFNLKRGAIDIQRLTSQALRAYDLVNWHAELYVDGKMLASLEPVLSKLPAVSIDHLGMSGDALPYLLNLVERGARVKATGFGRIDLDIADALRRIHVVNPQALMFGSDLPGTRADRTFQRSDLELIGGAVGTDLEDVLTRNARAFYRLPATATTVDRTAPTKPFPRLAPKPVPSGETTPMPAVD